MKYFNENDVKNIKSYNFDFIEFEESNHVFTLTLDRPKKKNALNPQMINEIAFAFQYVSTKDSIRALLLKSNGDIFCSGLDLKAINGEIEKNNSTVPKANSKILIGELFNKLYKPKICQLEGDVYAGGFLLIAGCNYVVSIDGLKLGLPEVKRGIFPMQVMESLSKIISSRNVIDWCIRGNWLNEVVSNSPIAIQYGLEAFDKINSSESNHKYLLEMLELVLKSDDAIEGIAAFKEKRNPNWK